jgi:hypothetical protein
MAALDGLASALESYRGRDRLVRLGPRRGRSPGVPSKLRDGETEATEGAVWLRIPSHGGPVLARLKRRPLALDI